MKILHVVQGYHPAIGGTEHLIKNVSEKLIELFGDQVTVYTTNAYNAFGFNERDQPLMPPGRETINGVRVRRYNVWRIWPKQGAKWQFEAYARGYPFNEYIRALWSGPICPRMFWDLCFTSRGFDVAAASSFPLLHMQYLSIAGRFNRWPVVLHGGLHPEDKWGFDRAMIWQAIRRCDAYIANTTYERDYLVAHGIPGKKITVIGVGVDLPAFLRADGDKVRTRYGWGGDPVVAFIGQHGWHKGIDTLIAAMSIVWREFPAARLLIAGARTPYSATIEGQIAALGKKERERITLVYNFPDEEKPRLFAACDVFAYPSGYESFGTAFVEAWAAGKPVIGCRAGAIPSVIDEGVDGLLVPYKEPRPLAEAILVLLKDEGLRDRLGSRGQAKVQERYTWDIVARKFREVYERALFSRRRKK